MGKSREEIISGYGKWLADPKNRLRLQAAIDETAKDVAGELARQEMKLEIAKLPRYLQPLATAFFWLCWWLIR